MPQNKCSLLFIVLIITRLDSRKLQSNLFLNRELLLNGTNQNFNIRRRVRGIHRFKGVLKLLLGIQWGNETIKFCYQWSQQLKVIKLAIKNRFKIYLFNHKCNQLEGCLKIINKMFLFSVGSIFFFDLKIFKTVSLFTVSLCLII